jgi:hypothetical protein
LLDYDGDSLRPRIFPRIFAAAAIIVLTAGLAAAVYFALPKSHRNAQIVANTEQTRPADASGTATEPAVPHRSAESEKDAARDSKSGAPIEMADAVQNVDAVKMKSAPELDNVARDVAANSDTILAAANGVAPQETTPASINNAVVMLVRTDKPEAAQKELTDYLTSNRIQWRPAEPAQPSTVLSAQQDQSADANSSPNGGLRQEAQIAQREEQRPAPQYAAKTRAPDAAISASRLQSPAMRGATSQQLTESFSQQNPGGLQAVAQQPGTTAYPNNSNSVSNARANGLYVARMSRSQARALSLSMNQGQQAAEVKEVNAAQGMAHEDRSGPAAATGQAGFGTPVHAAAAPTTQLATQQPFANSTFHATQQDERQEAIRRSRSFSAATTQPVSDVIAAGEELRLVSFTQDSQLKKAASEEPVQTVRVAADGTVNLPNLGVFRCAGLTIEQANQALAQAAASDTANRATPSETLKVERLGAALSGDRVRVSGGPTTQPVATKPALASVPSADEPVNVVIVVEPNAEASAPANAAAPTTQPDAGGSAPAGQIAPQTAPAK